MKDRSDLVLNFLRVHNEIERLPLKEKGIVGRKLKLAHIDTQGAPKVSIESLRRHDVMAWHVEAGVETVLDGLRRNTDLYRTNTCRHIGTAPWKLDSFELPCFLQKWRW